MYFFLLAAGLACVFVADFWGTSAHCWTYYLGGKSLATRLAGVGFGMFFDTGLVMAAVRAARMITA